MEIAAKSCMEAWKVALRKIVSEGLETIDKRPSREVANLTIRLTSTDDAQVVLEILRSFKQWSYPELDELKDIMLKQEASGSYQYTYGLRIFKYSGVKNQVDDFIIPLLKADPRSRKAVVVLYHPIVDSKPSSIETPSLISIHFRIVDGKLHMSAVFRSSDMFIGWPANIYQLKVLLDYACERLELEQGSITTISHSAHIFNEHIEEIEKISKAR